MAGRPAAIPHILSRQADPTLCSHRSLLQNSGVNGSVERRSQKNKIEDKCLKRGLNCVKLLSPNKPDTETTPYAAHLAPSRHAIRSHVAGGIISTIAILRRAAERADAVARLGDFFCSFGANVIRAAGRQL